MRRYVMVLITVQLLIPAAASAVTTTVTQPAGGTRFFVDGANPPTIHYAGTADVAAVDLKCVTSQGGSPAIGTLPLATNVPVTAGSWSVDAPWPTNGSGLCEIFAIDHNSPPPTTNSDLAPLTGAKVYPGYVDLSKHAGKTYDYYASMNGPGGYYDFDSFGDCTMDFGQLAQLHEYDSSIFDCNGYVESADRTATSPQPSVKVDDQPAYPTYYIGSDGALRDLPGWTGLTLNLEADAGAWHLTSREGIFRCANSNAFPPNTCTGFAPTGLALDVDERQSADGRTLVQDLRFVNETDQAHTLSLVLNQTSVDTRQWFFPGTGGFQDYALNASPATVAPSVATIRNQLDPPTPEGLLKGVGAITYAATPSAEQFWDANDFFAQKYTNLTIPAGRATRVHFIYNIAATAAGLDGQVAAAEASIGAPPAISVTSPATATAAPYTLTGTVSAPEGLNALSVNGQPAAFAGDGTFSVPETLVAGANAFTLTATDELGRAARSPFSVTLATTTPPPGNPLAVTFGRSGRPSVKGRSVSTGSTAGCPGAGPDCTVAARATANPHKAAKVLVAAKRSLTVKAGATAKIKLKLSKAAAKLLKRRHRLKIVLVLTGTRTGATTATATRTITLKLKKKR
jgi:Glucodextranase, domain B